MHDVTAAEGQHALVGGEVVAATVALQVTNMSSVLYKTIFTIVRMMLFQVWYS
jgi:hypothetical protein